MRSTQPSTQNIVAIAKARLHSSAYRTLRAIDCEYKDGSLLLHGCLSSFYHKQLAQHAVANIAGVAHVVNRIEVMHRSHEN